MKVFLEDIRLFGYHGVFPSETKIGNEFRFDVSVDYPDSLFFDRKSGVPLHDNLENTISYADIFEIVRQESAKPRKLLETLAISICQRIKTSFPQTDTCSCRITKLSPPIAGMQGHAGVEFIF